METNENIKIIIGNVFSKLEINPNFFNYFQPMLSVIDENLSFPVLGREYSDQYNRFKSDGTRLWDGKKHLINLTGKKLKQVAWLRYITEPNYFLTGNIIRVLEVMHQYGIKPTLEISEDKTNINIEENKFDYQWDNQYEIRNYQKQCIDVALKNKRGLIQLATGGGKTIVAARIIKEIGLKNVLFLVTTKELLYQAKRVFETVLNDPGVGIIGDGKCEISNINVATIQTIVRCVGSEDDYKNYIKEISSLFEESSSDDAELDETNIQKVIGCINNTNVVFFDECQHAPASTCFLALSKCAKASYRFGLSATPFREDGEDLTIEGLFGHTLIEISLSYLIENDFLVKPKIITINMRDKSVKPPKQTYPEEYKNYIVENHERNSIISIFSKYFSNNDKTVLILVKQIKHGEILEKMIPESVFIDGKKSSKNRGNAIEKLLNRETKVLIATTLADEGLDIPSLDVLVLAGSGKSKTKAFQRIGRVLRKYDGKTECCIIDFIDIGKHCYDHSKRRLNLYKNEKMFNDLDEIKKEDILHPKKRKGDIL